MEAKLGRLLRRGVSGDTNIAVEPQTPLFELFEDSEYLKSSSESGRLHDTWVGALKIYVLTPRPAGDRAPKQLPPLRGQPSSGRRVSLDAVDPDEPYRRPINRRRLRLAMLRAFHLIDNRVGFADRLYIDLGLVLLPSEDTVCSTGPGTNDSLFAPLAPRIALVADKARHRIVNGTPILLDQAFTKARIGLAGFEFWSFGVGGRAEGERNKDKDDFHETTPMHLILRITEKIRGYM
jgi:hypothetical protein